MESYELADMMLKSGQLDHKVHTNVVRNRAEMFSYHLLATAVSVESIKHVCNVKWDDYEDNEARDLIKEAMRLHQVIRHKNW